jgi:DNA polymerase-3 subunit chi
MTRIDFAFGARDRLRAACQVARKRYEAGQRLMVYCSDGARLTAFDRLLWAFDDTAFVPHVLASDPLAAITPIVLTAASPVADATSAADERWLMNLDDDCPPHYDGFPRMLEIVTTEPTDVQNARQRWRAYQAAGHTLHAHDLAGRLA